MQFLFKKSEHPNSIHFLPLAHQMGSCSPHLSRLLFRVLGPQNLPGLTALESEWRTSGSPLGGWRCRGLCGVARDGGRHLGEQRWSVTPLWSCLLPQVTTSLQPPQNTPPVCILVAPSMVVVFRCPLPDRMPLPMGLFHLWHPLMAQPQ